MVAPIAVSQGEYRAVRTACWISIYHGTRHIRRNKYTSVAEAKAKMEEISQAAAENRWRPDLIENEQELLW